MEHIDSIDSELRDNLIYRSFCQLILQDKLENSLLIQLLNRSIMTRFYLRELVSMKLIPYLQGHLRHCLLH
jgi:hypothetical protein